MPEAVAPLPERRAFAETMRRDAWWAQPLSIFLGLTGFVIYATWAALKNADYHWGPYNSPFYSPEIFGDGPHSWFGPKPGWWPGWFPFSPALFILPFPAGFRLTCYYFRGAYYKSHWADPPSCAVGEPRKQYWGERSLPLVAMNVHRYFLYAAILYIAHHVYDVWTAMWFADPATGALTFGIGLGTLIFAGDVILLGGYVFGCHSFRHLVGGVLDEPSKQLVRFKFYQCASCLNRKHLVWAWVSLGWVMFADVYVRLLARGVVADWRIF